jgi:hypothetical protein
MRGHVAVVGRRSLLLGPVFGCSLLLRCHCVLAHELTVLGAARELACRSPRATMW